MVPCTHASQSPNGISIDSAVFAQLIRVPNTRKDRQTDRHTDHATYDICSNKPHMHCMQAKRLNDASKGSVAWLLRTMWEGLQGMAPMSLDAWFT